MDVAVTGSSGLIGSSFLRILAAEGHRAIPILRPSPPGTGARPDLALHWDPSSGQIECGGFEGLDAVVHLAGAGIGDHRWTPEYRREVKQSRVEGTSLLATTLASLARPPKVLVCASAIGYYGDRGDEVLDESSAAGDLFLTEVVSEWEAAARPASDAGIRVVFARSGIVLSADGGALGKMLRLFRLGLGGRLGRGDQWWSWITIDDEVSALLFLVDHDIAGPVNVVAPNPVTNAQFAKALGRALHRPAALPVPKFGPKLVLGADLAHELLFASQRVEPRVLEAEQFPFGYPEIGGAFQHLLDRSGSNRGQV